MAQFKYCKESKSIREDHTNASIAVRFENRWVLDIDPDASESAAMVAFATLYQRPKKRFLSGDRLARYLNNSAIG